MNGDFTRLTFRPENHYSSVRLQQGRVLLDADWNEQVDIQEHQRQTSIRDAFGDSGAPLHNAGFGLMTAPGSTDTWSGIISPGRYYVDGILCENELPVDFAQQPDLL